MKILLATIIMAAGVAWAAVGGILPAAERYTDAQERIAQVEANAAIRIAEANMARDMALAERDTMIAAFSAAQAGTREMGATLRLLVVAGFLFLSGCGLLVVALGWQGAQQGYTVKVGRAHR